MSRGTHTGRAAEGLRSEGFQAALADAFAGRTAPLEDLLSRHGGLPGTRPNLELATAFGVEMAKRPGSVAGLLARLGQDDAAPDSARVFLPMAAAYGWVGRVRAGRDLEEAWAALCELAADDRAPVRAGTHDALRDFALREGGAEVLLERAQAWLDAEDRELRFGAAALVVEVLGDVRVLAGVRDHEALFAYLTRVLDEIADAPRSADRSAARRRALSSLPRALAAVVSAVPADRGLAWLGATCEHATNHQVRGALSDAIVRMRSASRGAGAGAAAADTLRKVLEGSAKPLRHIARVRPGTGRGKGTRAIR